MTISKVQGNSSRPQTSTAGAGSDPAAAQLAARRQGALRTDVNEHQARARDSLGKSTSYKDRATKLIRAADGDIQGAKAFKAKTLEDANALHANAVKAESAGYKHRYAARTMTGELAARAGQEAEKAFGAVSDLRQRAEARYAEGVKAIADAEKRAADARAQASIFNFRAHRFESDAKRHGDAAKSLGERLN